MTLMILVGLFIAICLFLIVWIIRRIQKNTGLRLHHIGTIIDRAVWMYRQHLVPVILLTLLCLPLGGVASDGLSFADWTSLFLIEESSNAMSVFRLIVMGFSLIGIFGIGRTLLTYGIAQARLAYDAGAPVHLGILLPRKRFGAVAGLVAMMIIPSLLTAFLGIIGALIGLLWAVAPVVMVYEEVGPVVATQRSFALVRRNYSALLNTLVPLWVIGWVMVGSLVVGSIFLLDRVAGLSPTLIEAVNYAGWTAGSVIVAPLVACGSLSFYLYVREFEAVRQELPGVPV